MAPRGRLVGAAARHGGDRYAADVWVALRQARRHQAAVDQHVQRQHEAFRLCCLFEQPAAQRIALSGRSQVAGPPFHRLDFSLFKTFRVTEHKNLEFRAESFNLTNTPNFGQPGNLNFLNTKTFANITSTLDTPNDARQIQFALKLYW